MRLRNQSVKSLMKESIKKVPTPVVSWWNSETAIWDLLIKKKKRRHSHKDDRTKMLSRIFQKATTMLEEQQVLSRRTMIWISTMMEHTLSRICKITMAKLFSLEMIHRTKCSIKIWLEARTKSWAGSSKVNMSCFNRTETVKKRSSSDPKQVRAGKPRRERITV